MNPDDCQINIPPYSYTDSPSMGQRIHDTASVQRISQAALVRDRLSNGVSPATLAGLAAMIAQMECQTQALLQSVTLTSTFPGF